MQADCNATVVSEAMATGACSRCMTRLPDGGARCKSCGTSFCSAGCLEDAGAEHAAECPALAMLRRMGHRLSSDLESARLLLRTLARRAVEAAAQDGEVHWRDVDTLLTHSEQVRRGDPALHKAVTSDAALLISILPPPVARGVSADDIALLLLRIKFNSHPILDSLGSTRVGLGLFPAAALANHACSFNAVVAFAPGGGVLSLRAVRAIRADENICYSYIDPLQPRR